MRRNEQEDISSTINLNILRELSRFGPSGTTAEHIANLSGISRPSVFRALQDLHSYQIVKKSGSVWSASARNPYVVKAVELLDIEQFLQLKEPVRKEIGEVIRQADEYFGPGNYAMIALGSAVGERPEEAGDVDIVIVVDEAGDFTAVTHQMKASISFLSLDDIDDQWNSGDSYIQEAVSKGLIIRDPLDKLAQLRVSKPRVFDREKALDSYLDQYKRELNIAGGAYSDKNWVLAGEHQNKAAAALASIWLLGIGVWPHSRPDLEDQLGGVCMRLCKQYVHLTKELPFDESHAEEREKEFWKFRESTSHLSDSTHEFRDMIALLYENNRKAVHALQDFFKGRGLQPSTAGSADLEVYDPEGNYRVKIDVKSSTSTISAKAIQKVIEGSASERNSFILIYNPHRNLPVDERMYRISQKVAESASKAGVGLIPSNAFFSWICDVIEEDLTGKELFGSLKTLCSDTSYNALNWRV